MQEKFADRDCCACSSNNIKLQILLLLKNSLTVVARYGHPLSTFKYMNINIGECVT